MRRIPKKIPASLLRQMDPELALKLETSRITFEADILEIQYRVRRSRKVVTIEITMTEKYVMRISPIRRGHGGFAEWGTYQPCNDGKEEIHFTIHAHIEIIRRLDEGSHHVVSFATQGENLKRLIQSSLISQLPATGKKLVPLKKGMSS
jgi:hypothetical protein